MSWFPKRCVVVPIDFSSPSDNAIQAALEITQQPSEVHVVMSLCFPRSFRILES